MRKALVLILSILLLIHTVSAEQDEHPQSYDLHSVDHGFSDRFNENIRDVLEYNFMEGLSFFETFPTYKMEDLEISLNKFIVPPENPRESYRSEIGKYTVVIYGIKHFLSTKRMSYFSIMSIINTADKAKGEEALLEFLVLATATILSSNEDLSISDAETVLFDKFDIKDALFSGNSANEIGETTISTKRTYTVRYKENDFVVTSTIEKFFDVICILEFKAFPSNY